MLEEHKPSYAPAAWLREPEHRSGLKTFSAFTICRAQLFALLCMCAIKWSNHCDGRTDTCFNLRHSCTYIPQSLIVVVPPGLVIDLVTWFCAMIGQLARRDALMRIERQQADNDKAGDDDIRHQDGRYVGVYTLRVPTCTCTRLSEWPCELGIYVVWLTLSAWRRTPVCSRKWSDCNTSVTHSPSNVNTTR